MCCLLFFKTRPFNLGKARISKSFFKVFFNFFPIFFCLAFDLF
jgi:hypothetical protein